MDGNVATEYIQRGAMSYHVDREELLCGQGDLAGRDGRGPLGSLDCPGALSSRRSVGDTSVKDRFGECLSCEFTGIRDPASLRVWRMMKEWSGFGRGNLDSRQCPALLFN